MKPKITFIVIILLTISCAIKKDFPLTYKNVCSDITLNSNKTFEYRTACTGLGGEFIRKGTWKRSAGDTLLLNTFEQPENRITTYKGRVNSKLTGKVRIQISEKNGALGFSNIFINDRKQIKVADSIGFVEFDTESIINIEYGFLGQNEIIEIDNRNYNEIDILIRDLDVGIVQDYFTDMSIVVTNSKIVFYPNNEEKQFEIKRK